MKKNTEHVRTDGTRFFCLHCGKSEPSSDCLSLEKYAFKSRAFTRLHSGCEKPAEPKRPTPEMFGWIDYGVGHSIGVWTVKGGEAAYWEAIAEFEKPKP